MGDQDPIARGEREKKLVDAQLDADFMYECLHESKVENPMFEEKPEEDVLVGQYQFFCKQEFQELKNFQLLRTKKLKLKAIDIIILY